ncbi:MAG: hypothetical protein M3O50_08080 [Myxococcota bacterium]|nr:hypothetical protein [Myxococcota bacterium]
MTTPVFLTAARPFGGSLAAVALALELAACQGCRSPASTPLPVASSAPSDAGSPTLRLYLLTDVAGALEPCGCTKDQLGGLDHFGAWLRHDHTNAPASLVASAGPLFFMDEQLGGERADQDRIKAETIARVLRSLDFVAMAPGVNDWAEGEAGLSRLATMSGAVVLSDPSRTAPPFASVVVREIGGLRVGFVGAAAGPAGPHPSGSPSTAQESVRRGVDEAVRQGANVLVALAAVGRGEAKRIADKMPELTAIVVGSQKATGDANTAAPQAEQVGDVLIVQASNHLQSVAVVELFVREPVAAGHLLKFVDGTGLELERKREEVTRRIDDLHVRLSAWERDPSIAPADVAARKRELVALHGERDALDARPPPAKGSFFRYTLKEIRESLGRDPSIDAELSGYYRAVNDHNRVAFADRLPRPAAPDQPTYIGIDACTNCHPAARSVWNGTAHARAYATLTTQYKEFNLECVGCHVTGYDRPGGSTVTHVAGLENVECEVCHGPGSAHALNPVDKRRIIGKPEPAMCFACHHPPHVEQFDAVARMKAVLGPGHGMPSK